MLLYCIFACSTQESTTSTVSEKEKPISSPPKKPPPPQQPDMKMTPLPPTDIQEPVGPIGAGVFKKDSPTLQKSPTDAALCEDCDVVLISICSLRKDYVSAYGLQKNLTPSIDSIAKEGLRFEKAYAASSFTLAGLTALLTGRFGSSTGVTGWDKGLTKEIATLPEVLGFYGYSTAAFTTNAASGFRPDYGLDRGFQHMEIYEAPPGTPDGRHRGGSRILGASAKPIQNWISKAPTDKPIFAMLHTRSAHFPFVIDQSGSAQDATGITDLLYRAGMPSEDQIVKDHALPGMAGGTKHQGVVPIQGRDPLQVQIEKVGSEGVDVWKRHYADAVNRMDLDIALVVDALKKRGRWDKTILIIVADHGESLNDHGELLHGDGYYDGVTNVPLIIKVPGFSAGTTNSLVSHVDIMPTILELIGAMEPSGIDGVSMLPLFEKNDTEIRSVAFSEGGVAKHSLDNLPGAVYAPPWVLLRQKRGCSTFGRTMNKGVPVCLYNMETDPEQNINVADDNRTVVKELLTLWSEYRSARSQSAEQLKLTPEFIEELRRNGYNFSSGTP